MAHYKTQGATEIVFHARIATAGSINLKNTHPFTVRPGTLLFHNGILREVKCDIDSSMSDTWHYARSLEPLLEAAPGILQNEEFIAHVDAYAKKEASKFVIMDVDGTTIIFNDKAGVKRDGNWYSNHSAFEPLYWAGGSKLTAQAGTLETFAQWQARTNKFLTSCDHGIANDRFCKKCDRWARRRQRHAQKAKTYGRLTPLGARSQAGRLRDERPSNARLMDAVHEIMYKSGLPIDAQVDAINSLPFGHDD
jgi:hypothetical protein